MAALQQQDHFSLLTEIKHMENRLLYDEISHGNKIKKPQIALRFVCKIMT